MNKILPVDVDLLEQQGEHLLFHLTTDGVPESHPLWGLSDFLYQLSEDLRHYSSVKVENVERTNENKEQGPQNVHE